MTPDLVMEILARLPVKSLLRFRCVSKSWLSLIDSTEFSLQHLKLYNPNSANSRLLLGQKRIKIHIYTLTIRRCDTLRKDADVATFGRPFKVLQSLNGLLLISSGHRQEMTVKLWNPSVRKCLVIPNCPIQHRSYNLGFALRSKDYKLVAIDYKLKTIAVYSLNDHRWNINPNPLNINQVSRFHVRPPVYSQGVLYWHGDIFYQRRDIFCYDFDVEEFSLLPLPDAVKKDDVWFIFRLGESLGVFSMSSVATCIWLREKNMDRCYWSEWFKGEPNSNAYQQLFQMRASSILFLQQTNTFLMVQKSARGRDRVKSYNFTTHEIQHLGKSLQGKLFFDTYMENLALHNGIDGQTLMSFPEDQTGNNINARS
ncbi:hypothetical protein RDABS01_011128 [Bienertia sinuspersici]